MPPSLLGLPARYEAGLVEVADGVLAWLQPNGGWGESNAAVILGDGEAAIVDTLFTPGLTQRMLAALDARSTLPVRTLINTHSDGDHVWGNELLAGAEIIATEAAGEIIRHDPPSGFQQMRRIAGLLGLMPGPLLRRLPVLGDLVPYVQWMLAPYDLAGISLIPPTREFTGELRIDVGGRTVILEEVGPAHTPGDLIVYVPDQQVVIAADVLFIGVHPVLWAGSVSRWIDALDRILEHNPTTIIPGHGPLASTEDVHTLRDYLTWIQQAAERGLEEGRSPKALAAELVREAAGAPWAGWDGPERMVITIAAIDRHQRGAGAAPITPIERARVVAQVAALARELGQPPFA